ncbi:MAG: hypothetical protein PHU85_11855 [Phycisphaerae bacterium]|nr:hypothetical protein [Phycisphaerae bacterium]
MRAFKDSQGREWLLNVNTATVKTVRAARDVDLLDTTGEVYERLADDPVLLVDVLWLLCQEQAHKVGLSDAQFGEGLVGDAIEEATAALMGAIADFTPSRKRVVVLKAADLMIRVRQKGTEMALGKIGDPSLEGKLLSMMEQEMDEQIRQLLTRSSSATSAPASSESTPTPGPSAS